MLPKMPMPADATKKPETTRVARSSRARSGTPERGSGAWTRTNSTSHWSRPRFTRTATRRRRRPRHTHRRFAPGTTSPTPAPRHTDHAPRGGFGSTGRSSPTRELKPMRRVACDERADWLDIAEQTGLHVPHHRRRALLGRARLLRLHAGADRARHRGADGGARRDVPRAGRARRRRRAHAEDPADSAGVLELDRRELQARRSRASTAASTCATTGKGPAKLLEYNADTPTAVFETAVFQWKWLEDAIARKLLPPTPTSSIRCMSG